MKFKIAAIFLFSFGLASAAVDVVVPSKCAKNDLKKVGPQIISVCEVTVVTVPITKQLVTHLTVMVDHGVSAQKYFYEQFTPPGLSVACATVGSSKNCLRHYRIAGVIVNKNQITKSIVGTIPTDITIAYTTTQGSETSLSGKFLGLDFSAKSMKEMFNAQSY